MERESERENEKLFRWICYSIIFFERRTKEKNGFVFSIRADLLLVGAFFWKIRYKNYTFEKWFYFSLLCFGRRLPNDKTLAENELGRWGSQCYQWKRAQIGCVSLGHFGGFFGNLGRLRHLRPLLFVRTLGNLKPFGHLRTLGHLWPLGYLRLLGRLSFWDNWAFGTFVSSGR